MKRILLFCAACIVAMSTFAAELNIYASGLKAGGMSADKKVQVEYLLNAPATALEIHVLNADNTVALTVPVTEAALLTKGSHTATIDVSTLAVGEYGWEVKASAEATTEGALVNNDRTIVRYNFFSPQGIAVDNSFESPYFGRIYVSEARSANTSENVVRPVKQGIYIFNPLLEDVLSQGNNSFDGGVAWNEDVTTAADGNGIRQAQYGPFRLAVDADGYLFICDNSYYSSDDYSKSNTGVWMMDPANPSANFKEILDVTQRGKTFHRINSLAVSGRGTERVLYVNDWTDSIVAFPIGTAENPYSEKGTRVINALSDYNIANGNNTIQMDGRGGWWIFQYRAAIDQYPILAHINADGVRDYVIDKDNNTSLVAGPNRRGGGAVSPDGKYLAFNAGKTIYVFAITYGEDNIPSLTQLVSFPGYTNCEGFGFDVAGNLYTATASYEIFEAWATPKADNSFVTPAPKAQPIKVESIVVSVTGVTLDKTAADMKVGEQLTLVATVAPADATNKTVTWTSSDAEVAAVNNEGMVSALKAGSATITVKTVDGEITATCALTITNVDVESVALNKTMATIYKGETVKLDATILPANATNKNVTWTTTDEAVATVDAEGLVTAVAPGTATITVTTEDKQLTATCAITVPEGAYPNIYAYGLKLESTTNGVTIGFNLNAPATEVNVIAYDAEQNEHVVATLNGAEAEYQTVELNTSDLAAGTYTWAVEAKAELVTEDDPMLVRQYASIPFAAPRGLAIDNNTNSPYFGQIYVADGGNSSVETSGLYVIDPKLESDEQLYTSGWSATKASPMRPTVGEDGLVYVSDWSDNETNIHIFNPANPTEEKLVFGGTFTGADGVWNTADGKFIHGSMSSCYVTGTGADRVLYTFDEDYTPEVGNTMCLLRYDIGALETAWDKEPSAVVYNNDKKFEQNGNSRIIPSVAGGWWISQDRAGDSGAVPALIHVAGDTVNYNSNGSLGGRTRGAIAFNDDQTLCITAADNALRVNQVIWTDGVPTLKTLTGIPTTFGAQTSSTCYDIALDRAGNIYASGDGKTLSVWAVYKDENACITPAADGLTFEVVETGVENIEAGKLLKKGVYSVTGQYLGEDASALDKGIYIINGEKVIK